MMEDLESGKPKIKSIGTLRRKVLRVSKESLVKTSYLEQGQTLPLIVEPTLGEMDAADWATSNRDFIDAHLSQEGAILLRNFGVRTTTEFERFIEAASGELLEYSYRSTPRSQVSGRVYTSTEYPADQWIPLHNEMSYSRSWPMKIFFFA